MEILKLHNPVYVDGKEVYELPYDPEEITIELFMKIDSEYGTPTKPRESDNTLHMAMFWAAAMAVDDKVDLTGINNVKGMKDMKRMMNIGRDFIVGSEDTEEENSDPTCAILPEPSIQE